MYFFFFFFFISSPYFSLPFQFAVAQSSPYFERSRFTVCSAPSSRFILFIRSTSREVGRLRRNSFSKALRIDLFPIFLSLFPSFPSPPSPFLSLSLSLLAKLSSVYSRVRVLSVSHALRQTNRSSPIAASFRRFSPAFLDSTDPPGPRSFYG